MALREEIQSCSECTGPVVHKEGDVKIYLCPYSQNSNSQNNRLNWRSRRYSIDHNNTYLPVCMGYTKGSLSSVLNTINSGTTPLREIDLEFKGLIPGPNLTEEEKLIILEQTLDEMGLVDEYEVLEMETSIDRFIEKAGMKPNKFPFH